MAGPPGLCRSVSRGVNTPRGRIGMARPVVTRFADGDDRSRRCHRSPGLGWARTPLVFLAGLGNTPHVYDDFASSFTDSFHVYGITRRGFGNSIGRPAGEAATLVSDLRAVLDSLRLSRVILVGHSIGGEELTGFATVYPDRCGALVYLDAASDRSPGENELTRELEKLERPAVYRPGLTSADSASLTAIGSYYARNAVRGLPEAEVRAITRLDSAGRYAGRFGYDSIGAGYTRRLLDSLPVPAYQRLRCPSLAIYAVSDSAAAYFPWYGALDAAGRRMPRGIPCNGPTAAGGPGPVSTRSAGIACRRDSQCQSLGISLGQR